ncbi:hypothetical protein PR048_032750 [Dryococelus australis]|uniref:DDE Tnp4 domain-containing protein n=1 Tax=Dryococelus australis TaxID=614101 RepID=A0ABQ9G334_9NEOP|nr:hypothetical protein PR048_032750 [Dryococelus australis]
MAVVDSKYEFIMHDVGTNGSISDVGVINNTKFYFKLTTTSLQLSPDENPNDNTTKFPYVLVGDEAFAFKRNCLMPFNKKQLNNEQTVFNFRLSRTRRTVENIFGVLSNRFTLFHSAINLKNIKHVNILVLTCCYLQNFLRRRFQDSYMTIDLNDTNSDEIIEVQWLVDLKNDTKSENVSNDAKYCRSRFVEYFVYEEKVEWQDNSQRTTTQTLHALARRSDEALGVRVSVARIAPSRLDLGRRRSLNKLNAALEILGSGTGNSQMDDFSAIPHPWSNRPGAHGCGEGCRPGIHYSTTRARQHGSRKSARALAEGVVMEIASPAEIHPPPPPHPPTQASWFALRAPKGKGRAWFVTSTQGKGWLDVCICVCVCVYREKGWRCSNAIRCLVSASLTICNSWLNINSWDHSAKDAAALTRQPFLSRRQRVALSNAFDAYLELTLASGADTRRSNKADTTHESREPSSLRPIPRVGVQCSRRAACANGTLKWRPYYFLMHAVQAEKQFHVGTRRLVVCSQRDRSTSSLIYAPSTDELCSHARKKRPEYQPLMFPLLFCFPRSNRLRRCGWPGCEDCSGKRNFRARFHPRLFFFGARGFPFSPLSSRNQVTSVLQEEAWGG